MSGLLATSGITKRFDRTVALDGVDLTVDAGTIHAVLGENGAGKTTLLRILFGLLRPDAGALRWRGRDVDLASPAAARAMGIGMVHQHFMLVDAQTVWENLWLAHPDRPRFHLDRHRARRAVDELSERFSLALDPDARVGSLPVGARQRLEIAKALTRPVDLLLLDEPTAVLAPAEIDRLFEVMRGLADAGTAILFISHKLREVLHISEEITVLRHGRVTARCRTEEADEPTLARSIVGDGATEWARTRPRHVKRVEPEAAPADEARLPGGARLRVQGLSSGRASRVAIRDVSFEVCAGEILGLTGVDGNGQEELVALLAGVAPADAGRVEVRGREVTRGSARGRRRAGLAVVPGDRGEEGLVGEAPVWENLALRDFGERWARQGLLVSPARHVQRAEQRIRERGIRATAHTPARHLSGGNQQKLVLARELEGEAVAIVLLNPTRGLDVGAADSLLRELTGLRDEGRAILLVSTELDEVLSVADRVAVLSGGRFREVASRNRDEVGALMLGAG